MSELVRDSVLQAARKAHPEEIGGVLVGVMAGRRRWITQALEVPTQDSGAAHYVVPDGVTKRLIDNVREHDLRLGYVGEWHVHPLDAQPSERDRMTMLTVAKTVRRPLLLVARRQGSSYAFDIRTLRRARLRPVDLVLTGPLPGADRRTSTRARET